MQLRRQFAFMKSGFLLHSPLLAQSIQCWNLLMHGPGIHDGNEMGLVAGPVDTNPDKFENASSVFCPH